MFGLSLDDANSLANWVYLIAGTVAVAATATTIVASFVMWKTSTAISEEKDRQLARFQSEASEKASVLGKETAKANERASLLEKESAQLRAANLELEQQIAPRKLGADHVKSLEDVLSRNAGKTYLLSSYANDPEAALFGEQLVRSMKWANVKFEDRRMSISSFGSITLGIVLSGSDSRLIGEVFEILRASGLSVAVGEPPNPVGMTLGDPNTQADLRIFIGPKPVT